MRKWLTWPFNFLAFLLHHAPFSVQRFIATCLGVFWFDVLRILRQVVVNNLGIAFPEKTENERIAMGRSAMINFCTNIVEYSHLPFLGVKDLERFEFEGTEHMDQARAQGKGVLLLTLHLGNGDLAMGGLALRGYPMQILSKEFKTKWLNEAWFGMREKVGVKFIPPRNSSYAVLKALKRGETVCFVLDQFTGPPIGGKTRFFGKETGTALGMAVMAERSEAPVIPAYTYRRPDGSHVIGFGSQVHFESRSTKEETHLHMTQVYTDVLERFVRLQPTQWMWLHKRWKLYKY